MMIRALILLLVFFRPIYSETAILFSLSIIIVIGFLVIISIFIKLFENLLKVRKI